MTSRIKLKESFEIESKHGAFFTGNYVKWTASGKELLCHDGAAVRMLGLEQGHVIGSFLPTTDSDFDATREDTVTSILASPDITNDFVITSHKSGLLRLWNREDQKILREWKSVHKGPVVELAVSEGCQWLATGGTDSSVRLWELATFNCIHSLKGCQGVISVLKFRPGTKEIFAAADDCTIRGWVIGKNDPKYTLASHYSKVTSLVFHNPTKQMISCGRDSVMCVWDLVSGTVKRTIPVYESLQAMVLLPAKCILPGNLQITDKDGIHVATGGEKGVVKIWQIEKAREVFVQTNSQISKASEQGGLSIMDILLHATDNEVSLIVVSADHYIVQHSLETFECKRTLAGFCDEILDLVIFGPEESHIVVASNSPDIKLYRAKDMHCQLLLGHTDLVLSLATTKANPCLLASAAKDNTVRIWLYNPEKGTASCVGVGERHTASVGALSFSQLSATWLLSAAQDECLKAWRLPENIGDAENIEKATLSTEFSEIAHQKDINCVSVSPNDRIVATASQDKTAKLWSLEGLKLLGVLKGHKRGVWCARFSLTDQILATGSADCTCKLWSIADLTCVKTLEGHEASVLRLEFVASGAQLLTAGGDGLLKLWTIKSSECVTTLDAHEGKIWALGVGTKEKRVVTGGADSTLIVWKDTTEEKQEEARIVSEERILGEQRLANFMHSKDFDSALEMSLQLKRPHSALKSIEGLVRRSSESLGKAINKLSQELQTTLLQFALTWNTNTRTCEAAQRVLEHILTEGSLPLNSEDLAQALAYTDKHFRRLSQLRAEMHFLTYTAERMSLLPLSEP